LAQVGQVSQIASLCLRPAAEVITLMSAVMRASFLLLLAPCAHAQLVAGGGGQTAAVATQRMAPELSPACSAEMQGLNDKTKRLAAAECEKKKGYADAVLDHLQTGEEAEAVGVTETSFKECAKFSDTCAGEVAPGVVQEIRFSGLAVTDKCRAEIQTAQGDEKLMAEAQACEQKEKTSEQLLGALNTGDLDGAVDSAHVSLSKCMKLSDNCAFQISPVLVNQVVTMAMMQQSGMMPVFASLKSATEKPTTPVTLLKALEDEYHVRVRKSRATAFLQRKHSVHRVSRLIMELALKRQ